MAPKTTVTNIIDGKPVTGSSNDVVSVINPSTGEVITEFSSSTVEDGNRAVDAAVGAFPDWAARTPGQRSQLLHDLVDMINENIDELAALESMDAGKPTAVARGEELPGIAGALRHFAGAARTLGAQAAGEFVAMLGESGVGKSSLLNCIAGLDDADAGHIVLAGEDLRALSEPQRARLRRERLGFVFQAFHLLPHLSVAENVGLPLRLLGQADGEDADRGDDEGHPLHTLDVDADRVRDLARGLPFAAHGGDGRRAGGIAEAGFGDAHYSSLPSM